MSFITFDKLGASGNLGSQIQQYASLYAIAKETGKQVVFSQSSLTNGFGLKFAQILDIELSIVDDSFVAGFEPIHLQDITYDSSAMKLHSDKNYNFTNVMHTYQYWYPKYGDDVLSWAWDSKLLHEAMQLRQAMLPTDKELVSIHVRRGDYLLPQHHHFCQLDTDYYSQALSDYMEDLDRYHFVVFSNDIEWCRENLIEGDQVTFIQPTSDYMDMVLMSLCDHNIIANSSFSWWGAYMNENPHKRVTSPTNYIKQYSPFSFLNNNYQLPQWKRIENKA
jgi:hypothetical protein